MHRGLLIARLSPEIREAAKKYDVEKYVLLELEGLPLGPTKQKIEKKIISGEVTKRNDLKKLLKHENKDALKVSHTVNTNSFIQMMGSKDSLEENLS